MNFEKGHFCYETCKPGKNDKVKIYTADIEKGHYKPSQTPNLAKDHQSQFIHPTLQKVN